MQELRSQKLKMSHHVADLKQENEIIKLADGANAALVKRYGDQVFSQRKQIDQLRAQLLERDLESRYSQGKAAESFEEERGRVKKLADDLIVQRQQILKVEFRNVELEQTIASLKARNEHLKGQVEKAREEMELQLQQAGPSQAVVEGGKSGGDDLMRRLLHA